MHLLTLTGHTSDVNALTVLSDGSLVSGSDDNTIKIWDIKNGQTIKTLQLPHFKKIRPILLKSAFHRHVPKNICVRSRVKIYYDMNFNTC